MQLVLVREATLHYRSEGFCRSTVIPSEGVSPTRNLLLPTRNGGDCALAWREILQGKAFQNDIVLRGRKLGKRFFGVLPLRMTIVSFRSVSEESRAICLRFFTPHTMRSECECHL